MNNFVVISIVQSLSITIHSLVSAGSSFVSSLHGRVIVWLAFGAACREDVIEELLNIALLDEVVVS